MSTITQILSKTFIASFLTLLMNNALAVEINIYDQPKADAKSVGKVDLSVGVIPIFTPQNSEWIKIADPRNGNVGWAKSTEVNSQGKSGVVFTQKIINDGSANHTYQVFEYSNRPTKIDPKQKQLMMQRMQLQQQNFQKEMQEMMGNMNNLYRQQLEMLNATSFPMITPVIVIPQPMPLHRPTSRPDTRPANAGKTVTSPASNAPNAVSSASKPAAGLVRDQQSGQKQTGREATNP